MQQIKMIGIIGLIMAFVLCQIPESFAGPKAALVNPMEGITQNEPQIVTSEEKPYPGVASVDKQSVGRKSIWITAGAVLLLSVLLGASGGGDDGGGSTGTAGSGGDSGSVSFDW
jgi:hypothetical protein